ncbi:UDP-N-acetylenolpyruvoylglucosamine reductase [plant metagenome]|uniref:UDP-N-acetylmuramate dehydrogenase n=1 Tax=plant metagenome TaxID=1297885 RepID=A0A484TBB5_9ZZZZ
MSNTAPRPAAFPLEAPASVSLQAFNTLGLACVAPRCVRLDDPAQLPALTALARHYPSCFVLGGGSNVVLPASVPGLVVRVGLQGVRLVEETADAWIIEAGAGESWHGLVQTCVEAGWDGLENLALIPGQAGAAPVQNIGAYGLELAERLLSVEAWDIPAGRRVTFSAQECRFGYRDSVFKHAEPGRWLIVSLRLALPRPWRPVLRYPDLLRHPRLAGRDEAGITAREIFDTVCEVRRAKLPDPAVLGNAGSFFKNPLVDAAHHASLLAQWPDLVSYAQPDGRYKLAAGWLIDRCGWKGRDLGRAGVHDRQALVLVNRGGADAGDILALAAAIQQDVQARYGVALEPEPVVVAGE